MTAGGGESCRFHAPGHILGGMTGGYLTLDTRGYWRPRQRNSTSPGWSVPPLDRVCAFLAVQLEGRVYLGRFQTERNPSDSSWETVVPPLSCHVTQDVNGITFQAENLSYFRGAEFRAASHAVPFDYDLSSLSVITLQGVLEPLPEHPCAAWAFGFVITPVLFGQHFRNLACQELQVRTVGIPGQPRSLSLKQPQHPNGLVLFWQEGAELSASAREVVAFFPEGVTQGVIPVIRYWPGDPATFFKRLAAAESLVDVPVWPEDTEPDAEHSPFWIVMGRVCGHSDANLPVSLTLAWREIQAGPGGSRGEEPIESLKFLRPVLAPGTQEYLIRERERLRTFCAGARPAYVRKFLARSFMEMPSRVGVTADGVLYPPAGRVFSYQELLQWHLLFPRWSRNTLVEKWREVSGEPAYPEALAWIFRVALDSFSGPGPHIPEFFKRVREWRIWQQLVTGSGPPDLEQATALRALASVAACAGWEPLAGQLRKRARHTARAWELSMDPVLVSARGGLSFEDHSFARTVHFIALSLLFWYDDLLDWNMVETLLSQVPCRPDMHPEWLVRMGVISLALSDNALAAWQTALRNVFDRFSDRDREPYPGFMAWVWPLVMVGGKCWPDLGTSRLNLAIPDRIDRQGAERWQAMTPLGICDLEWTGNTDGGRLAARFPAPVELNSIAVRIPREIALRHLELITDGECVPDKWITVESAERQLLLTFARRLRAGERLVLTL